LAKTLLEREVIFKEDLIEIIGKRPFETEETYPLTKEEETALEAQAEEAAIDRTADEQPVNDSTEDPTQNQTLV
jgi:hypothetical protein